MTVERRPTGMLSGRRRFSLAAPAAILVLAIGVGITVLRHDGSFDPGFDCRIAAPAYPGGGPAVLFDQGHLNTHTIDHAYRPFADLLRSDGYAIRAVTKPFTEYELGGAAILVLALPRGANDAGDEPAYTEPECDVVERWVRGGGSLLLVTDHWPYGAAASSLARRFGVDLGQGMVEDPVHHDAGRGDSHLVFSEENGLLREHPIVAGRNDAERVRRVLTFTGQSLQGPNSAVPFLALSESATERPPTPPRVTREHGNVRVDMEYGEPVPAAGRAQGLALETGAGRVVVLGEAGMLRAQRTRDGGTVGMNAPGYDDRQLALNVMHWLSHRF